MKEPWEGEGWESGDLKPTNSTTYIFPKLTVFQK